VGKETPQIAITTRTRGDQKQNLSSNTEETEKETSGRVYTYREGGEYLNWKTTARLLGLNVPLG